MEDGSGWFADPEVEGQERYFDGSEWTTEIRPADLDGPLPHLPDHVPELQRAFAAATADIEEVEARLGLLFDRAVGVEPGGVGSRSAPEPEPELELELEPEPDAEPNATARAEPVVSASTEVEAATEAESQPATGRDGTAQAVGVEALLGTGEEETGEEEDDDALAELDEALASEQPEKLKRGRLRRR
ncbi:MAG TPA: DUF2510 domain-containing protein [Acidimicrobiales bacterium]|nr:DUF2510 domain-containing protein [Acidimicrobiales bacterium]